MILTVVEKMVIIDVPRMKDDATNGGTAKEEVNEGVRAYVDG